MVAFEYEKSLGGGVGARIGQSAAGLPILFFEQGFDMALSGTLAAPTAWIGMALFIAWLVWTKRLPVQDQAGEEEQAFSQNEAESL